MNYKVNIDSNKLFYGQYLKYGSTYIIINNVFPVGLTVFCQLFSFFTFNI